MVGPRRVPVGIPMGVYWSGSTEAFTVVSARIVAIQVAV